VAAQQSSHLTGIAEAALRFFCQQFGETRCTWTLASMAVNIGDDAHDIAVKLLEVWFKRGCARQQLIGITPIA